jgi:hypothetical protein
VLGLQGSGLGTPGATTIGGGFAVRYDATQQAYIMDTPATTPGPFQASNQDSASWHGNISDYQIYADVLKPKPANPDSDFEFTTFAAFYAYDWDCCPPLGAFAFGLATPSGSVPTTGSATYDAIVAGFSLDSSQLIGGTAILQFDFGAGTLAGTFNPVLNPNNGFGGTSLPAYTFVNTVFGAGSTTFAGGLQTSGIAQLGSFNGLFTGPAVEELMARWQAPYVNPTSHEQSEIFGVWIGRKP